MGGVAKRTIIFLTLVSEGGLFSLALLLGFCFSVSLEIRLVSEEILQGIWATFPLLAFNLGIFVVLSRRQPYQQYRDFLDDVVFPLCAQLSAPYALFVSIAAGIGEEFFFRGILPEVLRGYLPVTLIAVLTSFLFSYIHFIGNFHRFRGLVLLYFMIGLYFYYLANESAGLVAATVCHIFYDFIVISYIHYIEIPYHSLSQAEK